MGIAAGTQYAAAELLHAGEVRPVGTPPISMRMGTADVETYFQVMLNQEYDFHYPREPKVIVDAGAHIGLSALWFAQRFPDARIFTLELERSNFELLRSNTARHPNIHPLHAAIWPTSGSVAIADATAATWAFNAEPGTGVTALSVPDVMARFDIDRIDLLKLDVEGAERGLLRDSAAWIDHVDMLVAELHDRLVPGCTRALMAATTNFTYEEWRAENILVAR